VALCLWMGGNGVALPMVKRAHYSNRLWAQSVDIMVAVGGIYLHV
jgi:hypothetical protein